jgi:hypothetical protein
MPPARADRLFRTAAISASQIPLSARPSADTVILAMRVIFTLRVPSTQVRIRPPKIPYPAKGKGVFSGK